MSRAIENLQAAQKRAMAVRPEAGGFPYLAEVLRQAGVKRNLWFLPSLQRIYITDDGPVLERQETGRIHNATRSKGRPSSA